jgi:hypothetical protein
MTRLQEASRKRPTTLLVGAASSIFQPVHPPFPAIDEISIVAFFALWKDAKLEQPHSPLIKEGEICKDVFLACWPCVSCFAPK